MRPNLIPIFMFFSLTLVGQYELKKSKLLNSNFSKSEIEFFQETHDFFYRQICVSEIFRPIQPEKCFKAYSEKYVPVIAKSTADSLPLLSKSVIRSYINSLPKDMFELIWQQDSVMTYDSIPRPIAYTGLNTNSKLFKQLSIELPEKRMFFLMSNKNRGFVVLMDKLLESGGISPETLVHPLAYPEKYNWNKAEVRLLIAINYLTISYD